MIKAILLAAGQSKRIKSENKLIKLYKKKPLLNHSLKALHKSKVNKVIIVLGHQKNEVKKIIEKNKKNLFYSIAGGGDTIAVINQIKAINDFNFVSTAGGAFLEYLEGKELPGIKALN